MAKPRSDSKLLNLAPGEQDRIYLWLTEGVDGDTSYATVREQIELDFGIKTSVGALNQFYHRVVAPRRLHAAALAAEQIAGMAQMETGDGTGEILEDGTVMILRQKAFEVLANPQADPKEVAILAGLMVEAQKVALKRRELDAKGKFTEARLDQGERRLALDNKKFMRETCALYLKWHDDQRAKEIAASSGTNSEKIERLGQTMFGEDWED